MRFSCSDLLGRRLRTFGPQVSPKDRSLRFSRGPPARWLQPTRVRLLDSSSPSAPHGTSGRRIAGLRTRRAPSSDATFTHDCTSESPAPVHRDSLATLAGVCVWEKGFCGSEPPIDFCNETYGVRAHPRASRPRPPRDHAPLARSSDPQAFAVRLPSRSTPPTARRGSTTQGGFAESRQRLATPAGVQPRTGRPGVKGPQPFGLFADLPPPKPAEHPFVTRTLPPEPGVVRSRLTWSIAPGFPG
jgi:hypothetical protein